MHEKSNSLK